MDYQGGFEKLNTIGQTHLLRFWDELSTPGKEQLLGQVDALDLELFRLQRAALQSQPSQPEHLEPIKQFSQAGDQNLFESGKQLITEGKVGCILLAGGQGSRLRFEGPKGLFPVSDVKQKSLFQIFAEKTLAAGKQAQRPLHLAIMTSLLNHKVTVKFFEDHDYFGLRSDQVSFFSQGNLPFLDMQGNLFLEDKDKIAEGPDGNGAVFKHFYTSGILDKWEKKGIRYINTILVDNPLADPFDAELIGFHHAENCQIVIKGTLRRNETEKVGLLVRNKGKVQVVEYSEMSDSERFAKNSTGELKHRCANLSLFSFALPFLKEAALQKKPMPLHPALKAVKFLDDKGDTRLSEKPNAWKYEEFIFDILALAHKVEVLLYPRDICFAPLKNLHGEDSLETVKESLQRRDRQVFEDITGLEPSRPVFELDQQFYYPSPQLLKSWHGRNLPNDNNYIEP